MKLYLNFLSLLTCAVNKRFLRASAGDFSLTDIFVYSLLLNSCQDPQGCRDLIHVKIAKLAERFESGGSSQPAKRKTIYSEAYRPGLYKLQG